MNNTFYHSSNKQGGIMFPKHFVIALFLASNIICQPVKIYLNTLTKLDEDDVHLVTLSNQAKEQLVLPTSQNIETPLAKKYFDLFYSWVTEKDEKISVLVYQFKNEDLLYVDKNNDNDLTNDGKPIVFPINKDSVTISITSEKDRIQKLILTLFRKPDLADSLKRSYIDQEGNLSPRFLNFVKIFSNDFNFEGEKRSFYFDYRITLRSGKLKLGASSYTVGLFDFSNNGRFNDERDLFIIDSTNTGKLNLNNPANVFAMNDVFSIGGRNYRLAEVDKYGNYLSIEETKEKPTYNYLRWIQSESLKNKKEGIISGDFWNKKLVSLDGEIINLSAYKGKYLLLNIWGEWCPHCITEIEELKHAFGKYKEKVNILGVMKVKDINKVKALIQDKNINWVNAFISDEFIDEFNISGYPTNIMIDPDGNSFMQVSGINRTYFDMIIK